MVLCHQDRAQTKAGLHEDALSTSPVQPGTGVLADLQTCQRTPLSPPASAVG